MIFLNQHMRRRNTFSNFSLNNIINLEQSTTDEQEKDEGSIVFDCDELTEAEKTSEWDTNKITFGDKTNDSSLSEANTFSSTSEQSLCISTIQDVSIYIIKRFDSIFSNAFTKVNTTFSIGFTKVNTTFSIGFTKVNMTFSIAFTFSIAITFTKINLVA